MWLLNMRWWRSFFLPDGGFFKYFFLAKWWLQLAFNIFFLVEWWLPPAFLIFFFFNIRVQ